jgi:hypothetical protein
MTRAPWPLQWPDGWARTTVPTPSAFTTGLAKARTRLLDEIRKLGGTDVVITSNMPTRRDGLPYATGERGVADPGVAVYWTGEKQEERVMACDSWQKPGDNIHAIALSVAALRGLERWGSSATVERAFAGFAALPPAPEPEIEIGQCSACGNDTVQYAGRAMCPTCTLVEPPVEPPVERVWRAILEIDVNEKRLGYVHRLYRLLVHQHHPDRGGDVVRMQRINEAWEIAQRELGCP